MRCRFCDTRLERVFVDLGAQPPSNSYLTRQALAEPEIHYPLKVYVCTSCFLVQAPEVKSSREIFDHDYGYFSSVSSSWLEHARRFALRMIEERGLGPDSRVVELASNDGYLLQYFAAKGIPCYGVEPSRSVAEAARARGIDTVVDFFGERLATELRDERGPADLVVANNVLAHVPDLKGFVAGIAVLLADEGLFTGEFPHVAELIDRNAFDTVYHEHYSYFSFTTIGRIFAAAGLRMVDVERLPTHGGSLRIHASKGSTVPTQRAAAMLAYERERGMCEASGYEGFQDRCVRVKNDLLEFLLDAKKRGRRIAAYGAAAKGNTLLNYCGLQADMIPYVADLSPHKQGLYLPGSRIEIVAPSRLYDENPDCVLLLPWNLKGEIVAQLREHGVRGRIVTAIPALEVDG